MITKVFVSEEVEENRLLSKTQPESYGLAITSLINCKNNCGKAIEVFAKDALFIKWICSDCS